MRIAVVTLAVGEVFRERNKVGVETTAEYCRRQGYDHYVHCLVPYGGNKHPSSYKLLLVRDLLPKYDWVLWIDADTLIMDHRKRLEEFLDTDKDFVFSHDCGTHVCCGIWFARNTAFAREQLTKWFEGPEHPKYWEQTYVNETLPFDRVVIDRSLSAIARLGGLAKREDCYIPDQHFILHLAARNRGNIDIRPQFEFYSKYIKR